MKRRLPPSPEDDLPEHLRTFRAADWPDLNPIDAGIRWQYARVKWRHAHGQRAWRPRPTVGGGGRQGDRSPHQVPGTTDLPPRERPTR